MAKSNISCRKSKLRKPYADFPLFPHARGCWAKTFRQKLNDFGKVADDPDDTKSIGFETGWVDSDTVIPET